MTYLVIEKSDLKELEETVNGLLTLRWRLQGGIAMIAGKKPGTVIYAQALVD